jgi:ketosteroid isomerase-like protein
MLPKQIDRFVEAVNRGDTEAFLGFFPDDGLVDDEGRRFVGRHAIRRWSDREFIGAKGKMTVKGVRRAKERVSVSADWVSKNFTGPSRFVFVLDGRWIREMRVTSV